jgi:hypothetical protein
MACQTPSKFGLPSARRGMSEPAAAAIAGTTATASATAMNRQKCRIEFPPENSD